MIEIFMTKNAILAGAIGAISLFLTATGLLTYSAPIVTTEGGKVQGRIGYSREGKEYLEYLSIPYGEAPVGELRFQPPVPAKSWSDVKQATKYPPYCIQLDAMIRGRVYGVEDCLYLNVFTHSVEPEVKKPVIVYIHGGGFVSGAANMYGPKYIMDEDIVLVTMNYRLGPLGFLNTGDELIRGNMGLKDQNMAMKWVKRNIHNFGGDSERITLWGESAGSASCHHHIISPASGGLFSRAILQSGLSTSSWAVMKNATESTFKYGKYLNCSTDNTTVLVNCLKDMDATDLVKPQILIMYPANPYIDMMLPSVETVIRDDTMISEHPLTALEAGRFAKMPVIMGVTSAEGALRTAKVEAIPELIPKMDKNWNDFAPRSLGYSTDPSFEPVSEKIRDFYFGDISFTDNIAFRKAYTRLNSDYLFFEPLHEAALIHSKHGAPTYLYYYDYSSVMIPSMYSLLRAVGPDDWLLAEVKLTWAVISDMFLKIVGWEGPHEFGVTHADDIFQLWNMEWIIERLSTWDLPFSRKFVKLFVDFARNENPLQMNGVSWPPVDPATSEHSPPLTLQYLLIRDENESRIIPEPFSERVQFLQSLKIRDSERDLRRISHLT